MKTRREKNVRKICTHARAAWGKCTCPWHFHFKWKGVHYRFSLDKHLDRHVDSKSAAEDEAAKIRIAIKAGTFGQLTPREDMTLRQLADAYEKDYVAVERAATADDFRGGLHVICNTLIPRPTGGAAPFGEWPLTDIVTATVLNFRTARRAAGTGDGGVNRTLSRLRALLNWGLEVGYLEVTPFKRHTKTVVRLTKEQPRSRRLQDGEEAALLKVASAPLQAILIGLVESGGRCGELLSLQWAQIEGMRIEEEQIVWLPRASIFLPREKTKTKADRRVPISSRLKGVLEMRRFDPAGKPHADDAFVFGSEVGTRVMGFKRAWATAVLKSHGHTPTYTATGNLTPGSRAALKKIDLHAHDLRREAGSRWLDLGVPLHTIRDWLGHSNISQTSTYLASTSQTSHDAMRQFEERTAALQLLASNGGTGGPKGPRSAKARDKRSRKTPVGRDAAIM